MPGEPTQAELKQLWDLVGTFPLVHRWNAMEAVLGAARAVIQHPEEADIHLAGLRRAVESYDQIVS
jgi:hypothetical protein